MRNFSDKIFRDDQNTHYIQHLFPENLAFYEKMGKNILEPGRPQISIWHTRRMLGT
jgi:hypothetical protein